MGSWPTKPQPVDVGEATAAQALLVCGYGWRWQGPGQGTWMVTVEAVVAVDTFPSTPSPSLTHTLISLQVWTCLEQEQGLGFRPTGCAQLPTDWPERGWLGLGTIPTDTASWACLA